MRQFNKTGSFGRRDSDGPKRRSYGRSESRDFDRPSRPEGRFDGPRSRNTGLELHKAVCAKCGESCEVPFKPSNNKPVYCRECFKKNEGSRFEPREKPNDRPEPRASPSSDEFEKINRKLDRIMKSLNIE